MCCIEKYDLRIYAILTFLEHQYIVHQMLEDQDIGTPRKLYVKKYELKKCLAIIFLVMP